jgi:oligosaccharide repeat unit polymerase
MKNKTIIIITSLLLLIFYFAIIHAEMVSFLLLLIFAVGNMVIFRKRLMRNKHVFIISSFFVFIYSFVPLIIYLYPHEFRSEISNVFEANPLFFKANLILLVSFAVYFYSSIRLLTAKRIKTKEKKQVKVNVCFQRKLFYISLLFLAIGCLSLYFYANIYGGLFSLIRSATYIRAGFTAESKFLFLGRFILFGSISSWLLLSLIKSGYRTKLTRFLFLISLTVIVINSLVTAGRQTLLMNLIILFFIYADSSKRKFTDYFKDFRFLFLLGFSVIFILYGKNIFSFITFSSNIDVEKNVFFDLISEFAHPYTSLLASIEYIDKSMELRGVVDIFYGLVTLLPERLLGIRAGDSVSFLNTILVFNQEKGFYPPGMIAYFYYSFWFVGVLIGTYIYNIVSNYFIRLCYKYSEIHQVFKAFYVFFIISFSQYIMSGDPRVYINSYFMYYFTLLIIIMIMKGSRRIHKKYAEVL